MSKSRAYSDEELEDGLDLLAELIDRYGDVYWPIYEFLERELHERKTKSNKLRYRLKRRSDAVGGGGNGIFAN